MVSGGRVSRLPLTNARFLQESRAWRMVEIDADLAENYRQIRQQRGLTWAQLAQQTQPQNSRLAAWMREQAAAEQPQPHTGRSAQPRGRNTGSREDT